jgi:hypothetical protein
MVLLQIPNKGGEQPRDAFVKEVVRRLTQHYGVVHRRSMVYYPQGNGLAESTKKTKHFAENHGSKQKGLGP